MSREGFYACAYINNYQNKYKKYIKDEVAKFYKNYTRGSCGNNIKSSNYICYTQTDIDNFNNSLLTLRQYVSQILGKTPCTGSLIVENKPKVEGAISNGKAATVKGI